MEIFELILSFLIGFLTVSLIGTLFSLKTKGLFRLALNSLGGADCALVTVAV